MHFCRINGAVLAGFLLSLGAVSASAQACRDRPMIERPNIIRPYVERPAFIRPVFERVVIEQPEFVRPMRERPVIETTVILRPLFDWCGDLVVPLDSEAAAPRVGRSLNELLNTGRYTPGAGLKRSYLAAVRAQPNEESTVPAAVAAAAGSCCGDAPAQAPVERIVKAAPLARRPQYRDQPPRRFPMLSSGAKRRLAAAQQSSSASAAPVAAVSAITAATMVVPRGSR